MFGGRSTAAYVTAPGAARNLRTGREAMLTIRAQPPASDAEDWENVSGESRPPTPTDSVGSASLTGAAPTRRRRRGNQAPEFAGRYMMLLCLGTFAVFLFVCLPMNTKQELSEIQTLMRNDPQWRIGSR